MYKMAWYDWRDGDDNTLHDKNPWYEYFVEDNDAVKVATQEVMLAWDGELKRWQEKNCYDGHPPDVCIQGMRSSMARRSPVGYTVYFVENAFRVEPVNA